MPFAAIRYNVKPGFEDEISEIFSPENFVRADSSVVRDENGEEVGNILATSLFIQDETMVRVIQYTGDIVAVGKHMSTQEGVKKAELELQPYLQQERDTQTSEGFQKHFGSAIMRCLQTRILEDRPANIAALRYKVKAGHEEDIAAVFEQVQGEARPALRDDRGAEVGLILGVALFVSGTDMVRVVLYDGELDDVAGYMAKRGARPEMERKLAPYVTEHRKVETPEEFLEQFKSNTMRSIQQLSVESATD